jgi:hypothetical protein
VSKLQGRYGCKRFLRDGYKTPKEVYWDFLSILQVEVDKYYDWLLTTSTWVQASGRLRWSPN